MRVRMLSAWGRYSAGDTVEPKPTLARWLVGNGFAERVDGASRVLETAMLQPAARNAMRPKARPRRGGLAYG